MINTVTRLTREYHIRVECAEAYQAGARACRAGYATIECPHGLSHAGMRAPVHTRETSEAALRSWWLAGWHDEHIAMTHIVA